MKDNRMLQSQRLVRKGRNYDGFCGKTVTLGRWPSASQDRAEHAVRWEHHSASLVLRF
jgi:hypothetical protein